MSLLTQERGLKPFEHVTKYRDLIVWGFDVESGGI